MKVGEKDKPVHVHLKSLMHVYGIKDGSLKDFKKIVIGVRDHLAKESGAKKSNINFNEFINQLNLELLSCWEKLGDKSLDSESDSIHFKEKYFNKIFDINNEGNQKTFEIISTQLLNKSSMLGSTLESSTTTEESSATAKPVSKDETSSDRPSTIDVSTESLRGRISVIESDESIESSQLISDSVSEEISKTMELPEGWDQAVKNASFQQLNLFQMKDSAVPGYFQAVSYYGLSDESGLKGIITQNEDNKFDLYVIDGDQPVKARSEAMDNIEGSLRYITGQIQQYNEMIISSKRLGLEVEHLGVGDYRTLNLNERFIEGYYLVSTDDWSGVCYKNSKKEYKGLYRGWLSRF